MSDRVTTTGDVLSLPFCGLELARTHDGRVVIQDPNDKEAKQFIMDAETFGIWAGHLVEVNVQRGHRTYSKMHARLVKTGDVESDFDWKKDVWCVRHRGQVDTRFDFEREEVDGLVAVMGTDEFLVFMANAPAVTPL